MKVKDWWFEVSLDTMFLMMYWSFSVGDKELVQALLRGNYVYCKVIR